MYTNFVRLFPRVDTRLNSRVRFACAGPPIFVHKIFLARLVAIPRSPIKTSRVEAVAESSLGERDEDGERTGGTLVVHSEKRGAVRGNNIRPGSHLHEL